MLILCLTPELIVAVYAIACFIATVRVVVSSNIPMNPDDYNFDTNFTFFTYHLPEDADFNLTLDYIGITDVPPDSDLSYIYNVTSHAKRSGVSKNSKTTGKTKLKNEQDKIELFLEMVEEYEENKAICKPGTEFNLGSGVIKQYGLNRFKSQALIAVNRANFLTRIWKVAEKAILNSEQLFYAQVRSIVESDPDIFAAGNCYDKDEFKNYHLFCPFAYRMDNGQINVKDLSLEYDYLGNTSEFFFSAKKKAARLDSFNVTKGKVLSMSVV